MPSICNGFKHISILIPTYNRSDLLVQTLQSISQIDVPKNISPEVVVVANDCTDETVNVCMKAAETFPFPLRCVQEPHVGASRARNRLLAEARGEILAFLDDDVWLDKQWLVGLLDIFHNFPADIVVGRTELWFKAVQKPAWMNYRTAHLLSCVDYGSKPCERFSAGEVISANMAIHRRVLQSVPAFRTDMDRTGRTILAGGDTAFIDSLLKAGHRIFYAPQALALHWVAPERITLEYLGQAAWANGYARIQVKGIDSALTRFNLIWQNQARWYFYLVMEMFYAATFLQKGRINNHIRRMTCGGILDAIADLSCGNKTTNSTEVPQAQSRIGS
jgi:glucosyl-dolichyl phosphate glucuronosyltransferase